MRKKLQVFISSTYEDLIEERQSAVQAILDAGHIPAGMELFTAGDESQKDTIKKWINESDVYLLILGGRYGTIDRSTGKSYTQWEYEYALSIGKPRFAVVITDSALEEKIKSKGTMMMEKDNPALYKEFRENVLSKVCKFYGDVRDIELAIFQKLAEYAGDEKLVGWVYGKDVPNVSALSAENAKLRMENDKLKSEVEKTRKDKQDSLQINGMRYEELKTILDAKKIKVPTIITGKKEYEESLLTLLRSFKTYYATGITNEYGMREDYKYLFFTLAPEFMTFDLLEKVKVAGVKYEKIQMSKNGFKFLSLYEQEVHKKKIKVNLEKALV